MFCFRTLRGGIQRLTHFDMYSRADVLTIKGDWNRNHAAMNISLPQLKFPTSVTGSAYFRLPRNWLGIRFEISQSPFLVINRELNPFDKRVLVSRPPETIFTIWKPRGWPTTFWKTFWLSEECFSIFYMFLTFWETNIKITNSAASYLQKTFTYEQDLTKTVSLAIYCWSNSAPQIKFWEPKGWVK